MHPIHLLALCLLSVTAFADANNDSSTDDANLDYSTPNSTESGLCSDKLVCKGPYYCDDETWTCQQCIGCCNSKGEDCQRPKCHCSLFLTDEELKIVAQAVLGVAVFVTCVALLSLVWKICARRLRQRRAAALGADLLDDTTSLSSQQVFVVERLRDRPPRYEEAARDIAIEKPPPYTEIAFQQVAEVERPPQTVLVGGVPITLVVGGMTARDFMAPPPYSPPTMRAEAAPSLVPPPVPGTPPVQRLRRCVRKVVMIRRLERRSVSAPETDRGSRPPKGVSPQQREMLHAQPGHSGATDLAATTAASESEAVAALPVARGVAGEEFGPVPGSPTSTVA